MALLGAKTKPKIEEELGCGLAFKARMYNALIGKEGAK